VLARDAVLASRFRLSELYRGGLREDVVIAGNSRAVHAFYAPALAARSGLHVFNLGYNGLSFDITQALVRDYLAHNAAPRAMILEVSNLAGTGDTLLPDLRPYFSEPGALSDLARAEVPCISAIGDLVHLYRYNSELFLRILYYLRKDDQDWVLHGTGIDRAAERRLALEAPLPSYAVDQATRLRGLLQFLVARGITPILVIAPYPPALRDRPGYDTWRGALQDALGADGEILDFGAALERFALFSGREPSESPRSTGTSSSALAACKFRYRR